MDCAVCGRNLNLRAYKLLYCLSYGLLIGNSSFFYDITFRIERDGHLSELDECLICLVHAHKDRNKMCIAAAEDNHQAMSKLIQSSAVACLDVDVSLYSSQTVE